METLTDETGINHVVVDHAKNDQEADDPQRQPGCVECGDDPRQLHREQLADLVQRGRRDHAEQNSVRHAKNREPDATNSANQRARNELGADIRRQRSVQLLDQPVTTQLPALRERPDDDAHDTRRVLQEQE